MGKLRFRLALLAGKLGQKLLRLLGRNATYFAGKAAIKLCPDFLGRIGKPARIIGVTGTNGKTTVCNMLADMLESMGLSVLSNRQGSNINAGVATAFIDAADMRGRVKRDIAVLEIDERSSRLIYPYVKPDYLICTNLFRDSMRRNAHPEYIAGIISSAVPADTELILNADDLISCSIAPQNKRVYFGIRPLDGEKEGRRNIVQDINICPVCGAPLEYSFRRYHHIGRAACPACGFSSPECSYEVVSADWGAGKMTVREKGEEREYPLRSDALYNMYNFAAAIAVLREAGFSGDEVYKALSSVKVTESRFFTEQTGGKTMTMLMSKGLNAVACSRSMDYIADRGGRKTIVLMLDDVFDEKSSSENIAWIYDTDFEFIAGCELGQIIVAGVRSADYRLRLLLAGIDDGVITAVPDEEHIAAAFQPELCDSVFLLYDLYRYGKAKDVYKQLKEKIEEASA